MSAICMWEWYARERISVRERGSVCECEREVECLRLSVPGVG